MSGYKGVKMSTTYQKIHWRADWEGEMISLLSRKNGEERNRCPILLNMSRLVQLDTSLKILFSFINSFSAERDFRNPLREIHKWHIIYTVKRNLLKIFSFLSNIMNFTKFYTFCFMNSLRPNFMIQIVHQKILVQFQQNVILEIDKWDQAL